MYVCSYTYNSEVLVMIISTLLNETFMLIVKVKFFCRGIPHAHCNVVYIYMVHSYILVQYIIIRSCN